jgi:hypothetical protein
MLLKLNFRFNELTLVNCCKNYQIFFWCVLCIYSVLPSSFPNPTFKCKLQLLIFGLTNKQTCVSFQTFLWGVGSQITFDFISIYEVIDTYPWNFESLTCKLCLPFCYLDHSFLEFICFQSKQLKFVIFIQMSSFIGFLLNPLLLLCVFYD